MEIVTKNTWSRLQQCHLNVPPVPWPIDKKSPAGQPEDFQITYLKPIFVKASYTMGGLNTQVKVVTEKIGDLLNMRQCYLHLELFHPLTSFTDEHIARCLKVFQIALRQVDHVEFVTGGGSEDEFPEWSFEEPFYVNYSTWHRSRRSYLKSMLGASNQSFSEKDTVGSGFTLCELIFDDAKFAIFEREWTRYPTHEMVREILLKFFPNDIVNKIFEMTCKPYPVDL